MTRPRCGNDPRAQLTDGDRQAVENFKAYLAQRAAFRDRIAVAALAAVEAALGDTLLPEPADQAAEERIEQAEADAEQQVRNTETVARERESYRKAWKDEQQRRVKAEAAVNRVRRLHDALDEETALTSPDDEITRSAAARKIAAALDGWTDPAVLRRMADETATTKTQAVDLPTLAAALDGIHTLIATSSRDWGTYRVDAWIWAVLCGWDCEEAEHDETCVHGALEETAARHGWDAATVAKARRYRAAVRSVVEHQPAAGARQDGAQP